MNKIPDGSVDLVLTDPPYGTTACKWDSVIPFEPMWEQLNRVAKKSAAIVLFGSEPFSSALRMSNIKWFKYDWIWEKERPTNIFNMKYEAARVHEVVSVFGGRNYYPIMEKSVQPNNNNKTKNKSQQGIMNTIETIGCSSKISDNYNPSLRYPRSILKFSRSTRGNKKLHPTQKPVALLEYLIHTYTQDGETVLDFTMGSGSTGVACVNTNRKFIGIELDKGYYDIAYRRIKEAQHMVI
jgi:site-specific DNA-methyltransferase (adenine-specific)